jgi:putative transposase
MARANRYFIPGYIWHLTHRCHKKEFLLKFDKDKKNWMSWLFEAKKRYSLSILNYIVTSNHVHLLVLCEKDQKVVSKSMQLIAGRTAQEYNLRKNRRGAFWQDRYHATAIESGAHLIQCISYIDLNIVRAGVVSHPTEWPFSGFYEIQNERKKFNRIDKKRLMKIFGFVDEIELRENRKNVIDEALRTERHTKRDYMWTENVGVGSNRFLEQLIERIGIKTLRRRVVEGRGAHELEEELAASNDVFGPQKGYSGPKKD